MHMSSTWMLGCKTETSCWSCSWAPHYTKNDMHSMHRRLLTASINTGCNKLCDGQTQDSSEPIDEMDNSFKAELLLFYSKAQSCVYARILHIATLVSCKAASKFISNSNLKPQTHILISHYVQRCTMQLVHNTACTSLHHFKICEHSS